MAESMTSDALRGFIIKVREHSGISQDKLAARVGMASRTYLAWETEEIKDLKAPALLKILQVLGVPSEWLDRLIDKRYEDGARLADEWISRAQVVKELGPPDDDERVSRLLDLLEQGVPPAEAARRARLG